MMKYVKLFEDWDANAAPLSKGEKLIDTVESHGLSVGDSVFLTQFKYGNETLTNIKGKIKQIQLSFVNETARYHYNIYFDTPIGNDNQVKRDHWIFGPFNEKAPNYIKKTS